MTKKSVNLLYVYMNNLLVGRLQKLSSGLLQFQYDESWLQHPNRRPISLSLSPLSEVPFSAEKVEFFFDNLLPDNQNIRKRLRTLFSLASTECFDLLSEIGKDCVGALQLLQQPLNEIRNKIEAKPIQDSEIAKLLQNYKSDPLGMTNDDEFRISIAGAQEKTALLWYRNHWHLPMGTTPTSHIIKLPIGKIQHSGIDLSESVENEWLCGRIIAAYGLPVSQSNIVTFDGVKTLVVERFDRRWVQNNQVLLRLPQEDLCQALGVSSDLKYESDGGPGIAQIMKLLEGSFDPRLDRENFMKSVFLFWVLGAIDGHAKNFSVFLEQEGRFSLTPLYDVMSAYPLLKRKQLVRRKIKMAMSLKSKSRHYHWHEIVLQHWLAMAGYCQFSKESMQRIIDEILDNMENVIFQVSLEIPSNFPTYISESVFEYMRNLKRHALRSSAYP